MCRVELGAAMDFFRFPGSISGLSRFTLTKTAQAIDEPMDIASSGPIKCHLFTECSLVVLDGSLPLAPY